jgi:nucleotide-binding universal stress UspA family protein
MSAGGASALRRHITVGVDGSAPSIDALLWARAMGDSLGAEIDAVTCWQYPASYGASGFTADWNPAADAAALLESALQSAYGDTRPQGLRTSVVDGYPANVLVEASVDAEMLVVGSRGHGGFVGLLIGATSSHCAEHASCAVLVVHDAPSAPSAASAADDA